MKRLFVFVLLALCPVFAQNRLETTWQNGKQSFTLSAGKISGFAGCNNFNGRYKQSGVRLEFTGFATTRKACEKSLMDAESTFLSRLASVKSYSVSGDGKCLTLLGDAVLRFVNR
ncbi:MAG: META domain-containing protein [Deinococcales bacterium]